MTALEWFMAVMTLATTGLWLLSTWVSGANAKMWWLSSQIWFVGLLVLLGTAAPQR